MTSNELSIAREQMRNDKTTFQYIILIVYVLFFLRFADDFVTVLERCKEGLKPGGCIVIKDNVSSHDAVLDEDDSSVTR